MKSVSHMASCWLTQIAAIFCNGISMSNKGKYNNVFKSFSIGLAFIVMSFSGQAWERDIFAISDVGEIREYRSSTKDALQYRYYAAVGKAKHDVVYFHGIESHAGWFDKAAIALTQMGYNVHSLDRRGSGLNREERGFIAGHVDSYETLFDDIDAFLKQANFKHKPTLIGLSWGGKLALSYSLARPKQEANLVLITPGLVSLVDVGVWEKINIFVMSYFSPTSQFSLPIEPEMFTTNPFYLNYIKQDALRNSSASASFLMESRALDGFVEDKIESNQHPILLFLAGNDQIIDNPAVQKLMNKAGKKQLTVIDYPEQTHSVQFDATDKMTQAIDDWLRPMLSLQESIE